MAEKPFFSHRIVDFLKFNKLFFYVQIYQSLSAPKKVLPWAAFITDMRNLVLLFVLSLFEASNCNVEITILHTNDIHSHFEEITARSGEKYGGIARRKTMVRCFIFISNIISVVQYNFLTGEMALENSESLPK